MKKIKSEKVNNFIEKVSNLAKEEGFNECMITEPLLKSQDTLNPVPSIMELTLYFVKPTKKTKKVFYGNN